MRLAPAVLRFLLPSLAGSVIVVSAPAVAQAATTVSRAGATITITGDDAPSHLTSTAASTEAQVQDDIPGASVIAGDGCAPVSASSVDCGAFGVGATIVANLGGGDDVYQYATTDVPQTVDGGAGKDAIQTGAGNDTILARDGEADSIDCGGGGDSAQIDALDTTSGCEMIDAPAATGSTPPATTGDTGGSLGRSAPSIPLAPTAPPAPPALAVLAVTGQATLAPTPKNAAAGKKLSVVLTANATCTGALAVGLSKTEATRLKVAKKATVVGTRAAFTLTSGASSTVTVAISSEYRSKIKTAARVKVTIAFQCRAADGRTSAGSFDTTLKK